MEKTRDESMISGRGRRKDGELTRQVILEAAGRVFAQRGYAEATSKEICAVAGVNSASVNYYFGGKEKLYEAVLVDAHRRLVSLEDLNGIMALDETPEERLRLLLETFMLAAAPQTESWGIKVLLRELAAPTLAVAVVADTVLPKSVLIRALVGEILGQPPDSPLVQRGAAFVALPCLSLILFPETIRLRVLPETEAGRPGMLEDLTRYVLAGLRGLKE